MIHATAVVSPHAEIHPSVHVQPYAVIEAGAQIEAGSVIGPHAVVHGAATLGARVQIGAHTVIGGDPQDLSFDQRTPTRAVIGNDTVIREGATVSRATTLEPTRVGAGCLLMGNTHLGHDCRLGDGVVVSQGAGLAGHVTVGDGAVVGGMAGVHQHVRIGRLAMVGGGAVVTKDVLPAAVVMGHPARHVQTNVLGMRRAGIGSAEQREARRAFLALQRGDADASDPAVPTGLAEEIYAFYRAPSQRGCTEFLRQSATARRGFAGPEASEQPGVA